MKKIVIFFLFFAAMHSSVFAQFRFGVHATPQFSWINTNDKRIEGAGSNFGFRFGVSGDFFLDDNENYALTTGLNLSFNQGGTVQNGYVQGIFWPDSELSESRFDTVPMDAQLTYHANYLEIPFGLKLRGGFSAGSPMKFYVELPVFTLGFLIKASGDIENTVGKNTEDENIREDVNGIGLSWGLGGGLEYEINESTTIYGGVFYQNQFTDFTNDKNASVLTTENIWKKEDSNAHINVLAIRMGVFF